MPRLLPLAVLGLLSLALLATSSTSSLALAGGKVKGKDKVDDPVNAIGEPKGFKAGESARYALWHDKKGWHLRTTTAKTEHHFVGSIHVEGGGHIEKVHSFHLEASGELQDHWKLDNDRKRLHFNFKTDKGVDGIAFHLTKEAKHVRFNLHIDGKHHAERIFVGHGNHHPQTDPFTLPAHPHHKTPIKKGCGEDDE